MSTKTTLKGIAEHLNLSISTVSKALADSPEISEATKLLVKTAARQLKYRPNAMARGLKSSRTNTLGVVIPNIMHNFFAKVIVGMEEEATKNGYSLVTCISNESLEKEKQSLNMLSDVSVDAIIISLTSETQESNEIEHLNDVLHYDIPLVMFDRANTDVACDSVVINDFSGAFEATSYLYKTGCKNVALLSTLSNTSVGNKRLAGYQAAVSKEEGAVPKVLYTKLATLEQDLGTFLDKNEIDAIITTDESSAIYAMNTIRTKGLEVPNDVSVIGFTDGTLARNYFPSVTTVKQQAEIMGKKAIEIALKNINAKEKEAPKQEVIETELVIRNSTRKL
ncbi:MAG: LacI family DNA-binding transcriptional regulator [Bacteroidota bacterium]|nr:LacI family DNA-binding transcriptional regulator [Bacteroidota bacterium]MEE3147914.1 LacI family DNA-binding transcriptional regulator [Bacteroidota bacterium]MEE3225640.1 LacI family DNA-binding transcriptional regulator [Bacteroidota bacterium]MEE3243783.1 LacI family DNA-binding transcriptional regulator [Bacteroidota bacterium]